MSKTIEELLRQELEILMSTMMTHLKDRGLPVDLKLVLTDSVNGDLLFYTFSTELLAAADGEYFVEERRCVYRKFDFNSVLLEEKEWDLGSRP